jgi:hypothetical protein
MASTVTLPERELSHYAVSAEMPPHGWGRAWRKRGLDNCSRQTETADPLGPAAFVKVSSRERPSRSFALMTSLPHFRKDAVEVVGLRRLHRRELLVRHQFLFP